MARMRARGAHVYPGRPFASCMACVHVGCAQVCVRACVFACVLGRSRVRAGPWCVRGGLLISMLRVCARVLTFCLLTKYACVYNATTVVVTGALQEKAEVMLSFGFVFVHLSGP